MPQDQTESPVRCPKCKKPPRRLSGSGVPNLAAMSASTNARAANWSGTT